MKRIDLKIYTDTAIKLRDASGVLMAKCLLKRGQLEGISKEYHQLMLVKYKTKSAQDKNFSKFFNSDIRVVGIKSDLEAYKKELQENSRRYWFLRKQMGETYKNSRHSLSRHFKITFGNFSKQREKMYAFLTSSIMDGKSMTFDWF